MQPLYYDIPAYKISVIATPKCANSSILDLLRPLLPSELPHKSNPHHMWGPMKISKERIAEVKLDRFVLAIGRNPWARTVSHYEDKVNKTLHERLHQYGFYQGMKFEEYLKVLSDKFNKINDLHVASHKEMFHSGEMLLPDLILRQERLK
ncbi:Sulfotransferase family protein [Pseudovibrio sp. Ad13]|uniref:sulfotransferase family 2 domain-containing protein n=1 Tax=Pseudovibrio sp. Ad13 TaxID=989396 RepID=UPI0007AE99E4|nr:sulfotransferase family 2 domain-containing protein [Pseudovibrio sp. Ad13]KZK84785.1 Sulfotransferase family protein [Pseudovibrio sp. Ad13]